jgi:nitrite reductase (cytochrome c-552)
VVPYRKLGDGDLTRGFDRMGAMSYADARKLVTHPIACIDCHDPKTMELRVTRPGFMEGIRALKASQGIQNYDVNKDATRQEMRSYVCGQCHVEYYFKGKEKRLTYPWSKGIKIEEIQAYYDEIQQKDWTHADTGAPVLKAQHPEFEMWSQGIHARSGVACADCHMPYQRQGAMKVSDHWVRSPLLNISRACQVCHPYAEAEIQARVTAIQDRTHALLERAATASMAMLDAIGDAKKNGAAPADLTPALELQRKAQWRLDFVAAENSMGFHAPAEAARILAESIDYARQGELAARRVAPAQGVPRK